MKIETKFDVGDTVYTLSVDSNGVPSTRKGTIKRIVLVQDDKEGRKCCYEFTNDSDIYVPINTFYENYLYRTEQEVKDKYNLK